MTGKTHQLFALIAVLGAAAVWMPHVSSIGVAILCLIAAMFGAWTPDIDHPASRLWTRFPAGSLVGRLVRITLGGHRNVSHSILGGLLLIWLTRHIFDILKPEVLADAHLIWMAYLIGFFSHLASDTITDHGIPWFWPLAINIRLPPGPPIFRVTTGSHVELHILRPILMVGIVLLFIRLLPLARTIW